MTQSVAAQTLPNQALPDRALPDRTLSEPMARGGPYADRFRALIRQMTGISLPPAKIHLIEQRLRRRVAAFDLPDTETYLHMLMDQPGMDEELRHVIDLITTNTTSFFRESAHFETLATQIVPDCISRTPAGKRPRLKLWSAASSEGAEAFTIAIVLAELQRRGQAFDYAILGTDISNRMLHRATEAIYDNDQLSTIPADLRARYFLTGAHPSVAGKARVVPELRRHVRFRHMNLMDDRYGVDRDVDVIFLRNVLIYFDQADKERVVARLASHLAPRGYLIVGHAESMVVRNPQLSQVKPTIFQKI
jgi:chemotaxis protein methyltransferase CheR